MVLCLSLTIASLSVLGVWSQSPPSPPNCVRVCSDSSAQSASCSSTDVKCLCNSDVFANDVAACIVSNCSATDTAAAVGYFEALCSGVTTSSVSLSGITSSTRSVSNTASGSGSVTNTAHSSGSTSGSSSSSPSSNSGLSSSTNSAGQSSVSSGTSDASQSSTSSITASSTSASESFVSPSPTPSFNHAVRCHTSMPFAGAGFALALAVALVVW